MFVSRLLGVLYLCAVPIVAHARDVVFAVPNHSAHSVFANEIQSSDFLHKIGITIKPAQFSDEHKIIESVLSGYSDVAMVSLDAISHYDFKNRPKLASIFTWPFLFDNTQDLFDAQRSTLKAAVFADISRTQLVPLEFWNNGNEDIISTREITSPTDLAKLTFATTENNLSDEFLTKLGSTKVRLPQNEFVAALVQGKVNAAIGHSMPAVFYKSAGKPYVTLLRPLVGIFFTSAKYWERLSEKEKHAWEFTAGTAAKHSNESIGRQTAITKDFAIFKSLNLTQQQKVALLSLVFPNDPIAIEQANLVRDTLDRIHSVPGKKRPKLTNL
jgi:TRAP-type C4-dicarboxylate transport system substrate-binding protein